MNSIFFNLLLNIGLLVLIATLLTKFSVVRQMFLDDNCQVANRFVLAMIFALVSILSTYTGIRTNGAIINTRVIGVLTAGLLGGPYVGIGAGMIAAAHRYLFDIGGFTAIPCMLSTIMEGLVGAAFSKSFRAGKIKLGGIFFITMMAEIAQMIIILMLAHPLSAALELVKIIALPMITMNALGMVIFITTFNRVLIEEESEFARKMRLAFDIADRSLPYLRKGLYSIRDIQETTKILYESFSCTDVIVMDREAVLAIYPEREEREPDKEESLIQVILSAPEHQVITFTECEAKNPLYPLLKKHAIVAAPLVEGERQVGSLVLIVRKKLHTVQTTAGFVEELAKLFSTQLELSNLEYQKRLRRKAELEALQSQVNPHFLYNALNTIACVCRENPDRARELIHTLSGYYRQTLENDRYMVNLHTELYHVNSYLELEKARFEEKLCVEMKIEDDINCVVPAFILQPLVENAVKHGVDGAGNRYVGIRMITRQSLESSPHLCSAENVLQILVEDHGKGFSEEVMLALDIQEFKKGIGLRNVHMRLKGMYQELGGLHLENTPCGAVASFFIPLTLTKEEAV